MVSEPEKEKNRFVLIDGNAILHRAYHALPPLTNRYGELLNAVYGFSTMLFKVIVDLSPRYLAVAFDTPKPTFRKMEYVGYQAKRPEMEAELSGQFGRVHEILEAMGIPIFEKDGFEADDVIGTLARKASEDIKILRYKDIKRRRKKTPNILVSKYPNIEIIIVTGDRDLMQLVGPKIKVYAPVKGMSESEMFDEEKVEEKMGVRPVQIIDLKGLTGDSSDNYPGVPGIGPKTAVELLREFGTLENVYRVLGMKLNGREHHRGYPSTLVRLRSPFAQGKQKINPIPESVWEKLAAGKELAMLSKKLATIVTNVSIEFDLAECEFKFSDEERERTIKKLGELRFKSLVERLATQRVQKGENSRFRGSRENSQQELF